jgi:hypothetical protein
MQVELLDTRRWKTRVALANAIFEYVEIVHNRRRHRSSLGMRTPIEYELVGFANSGSLVFVDESAEQIAAAKVGNRCQRRRVAPVRWQQLQCAVRSVLVVMAPVGAEHMLEMAAAEDG